MVEKIGEDNILICPNEECKNDENFLVMTNVEVLRKQNPEEETVDTEHINSEVTLVMCEDCDYILYFYNEDEKTKEEEPDNET